jgi:hypothetical protein
VISLACTIPEYRELGILVGQAYARVIDTLPKDHGHCREVSRLAAIEAHRLGLVEVTQCVGYWRSPECTTWHAWLRVGEAVLHSPAAGVVEITRAGPEFERDGHVVPAAMVQL